MASDHGRRPDFADLAFSIAVRLCALLVISALVWVLWDVARLGVPEISVEYLVSEPTRAGRSGGIAPIIISTLAILFVALATAIPVAVATAVWLSEYSGHHPWYAHRVRLALDALAGVPSIVFGLFGSAVFGVALGMGLSLISGGLTLACMVLPIVIRTTEAGLAALPDEWRLDAAALGISRWTLLRQVLLPAAAPAAAAGVMLGIGRALAESAALIFTSGYVDRMPSSAMDSGRTLAVHVWDLAMNVAGGDRAAYTAAAVLAVLVVLINLATSGLLRTWTSRKLKFG